MELSTQPLRDKTNTVVIVPVMDKSIKFMPLVEPLDSRLRPELVGVWNSPLQSWIRRKPLLPSVPPETPSHPDRSSPARGWSHARCGFVPPGSHRSTQN